MIDKINDIERAIDAGAYLSAMALALTIPDIFGKICFPKLSTGERYQRWFDENIAENYAPPDETVRFNGRLCFKLRCAYLHSGSVNDKELVNFHLTLYADRFSFEDSEESPIAMDISIKRLCLIICQMARWFYNTNKDKLDFRDSHITLI